MTKVKFFKIAPSPQVNYEKLIDTFPSFIQEKVSKYKFQEDRIRSVMGKVLLKNLLIEESYPANILSQIKLDEFQRPFLNSKIDFNISHSGDYVVCAISKNNRVGIDIEKVNPINIPDFEYVLTQDELQQILIDENATDAFYKIWTQKEAVIKANGKGLGINFTDIILDQETAICENIKWNLTELHINYNYKSYIAVEKKDEINISELTIDDLKEKPF
ncbi:4'-phosphopantetheinyl transferase superfamily protein [Mucilaginibacter corticis]|uniref:4'-phosphopantetheinyl transferase superfamily protein n=1 Tax=Mucilaginibacter corticis TaxID=2597670 RepID=A0A556MLK3_9SPHI|nr:4'-phosphopantetheinyl transferase superfamily protein [Mucilaginibacter corticis]TSJ40763.1 4'-phosphopantetheinyl transferase superfamily protein [Mucilaginibacter corticis]